jgi:hypothetical protein
MSLVQVRHRCEINFATRVRHRWLYSTKCKQGESTISITQSDDGVLRDRRSLDDRVRCIPYFRELLSFLVSLEDGIRNGSNHQEPKRRLYDGLKDAVKGNLYGIVLYCHEQASERERVSALANRTAPQIRKKHTNVLSCICYWTHVPRTLRM